MESTTIIFLVTLSFFVICTVVLRKERIRKPQKPNILFIMSMIMLYQVFSAYSDPFDQNPKQLDRCKGGNSGFRNASVTNSICCTVQATILTGEASQHNGKIVITIHLITTKLPFANCFQKAGDQTAMFGKLAFWKQSQGVDGIYDRCTGQAIILIRIFITQKGEIPLLLDMLHDIITDMSPWMVDVKNGDPNKPFFFFNVPGIRRPFRTLWWPEQINLRSIPKNLPLARDPFSTIIRIGALRPKTAEMKFCLLPYAVRPWLSKIWPGRRNLEAMGGVEAIC